MYFFKGIVDHWPFPIPTIKGLPALLPTARLFSWLLEVQHDVRQLNPLCKNSNLPVYVIPFYVCALVCGECDAIMTEVLPAVWLSNLSAHCVIHTTPSFSTVWRHHFNFCKTIKNPKWNILKLHLIRHSNHTNHLTFLKISCICHSNSLWNGHI